VVRWRGKRETARYSHFVQQLTTNDECRSSFGFVSVRRRSLSSVGDRFRTWAG
jgi:hypothetical protein